MVDILLAETLSLRYKIYRITGNGVVVPCVITYRLVLHTASFSNRAVL